MKVLESELKDIKWDLLGLSETRLQEDVTALKSGLILYQKNAHTDSNIGGVTILINKNLKHLVPKIKAISNRVIYIILKRNKRDFLQISQAYAPISSKNRKAEQFYEDIKTAQKLENV